MLFDDDDEDDDDEDDCVDYDEDDLNEDNEDDCNSDDACDDYNEKGDYDDSISIIILIILESKKKLRINISLLRNINIFKKNFRKLTNYIFYEILDRKSGQSLAVEPHRKIKGLIINNEIFSNFSFWRSLIWRVAVFTEHFLASASKYFFAIDAVASLKKIPNFSVIFDPLSPVCCHLKS